MNIPASHNPPRHNPPPHNPPRHHPEEATLISHATGGLPGGLALVVATHLAYCPACRRAMAEIEAIGGALLQEMPPVPMRADALAHALARLDVPALDRPVLAEPSTPNAGTESLPAPIQACFAGPAHPRWRRLAPGIRQARIPMSNSTGSNSAGRAASLLRIAAGQVLPSHGHTGREMTLVLEGSFSDALGRFEPGDFVETDDKVKHQPVAGLEMACLCLVAVEGRLRFDGLVGRIFQPLFGF